MTTPPWWKYTEATNASSPFFTIDVSLNLWWCRQLRDVIQYFRGGTGRGGSNQCQH